MKLTEGLLKRTFESIAPEYPDIEAHHIIVDNCAHQLVINPGQFDVIVTTNMNGDILSDLASGLVGGLGVAPSANLGNQAAIFEAVHGSAPDIAGQNIVNPTALFFTTVLMLRHLGHVECAQAIDHSLMCTLEDGIFTGDIRKDGSAVSTSSFTDAVIDRLGRQSTYVSGHDYQPLTLTPVACKLAGKRTAKQVTAGIDLFIEADLSPSALGTQLERVLNDSPFSLTVISNRGKKVYPGSKEDAECSDLWQCRLMLDSTVFEDSLLTFVLDNLPDGCQWVHIEKLFLFDGKPAFSKAQGED